MMSDSQTISKIELLPNEIFIECLSYLNGVDIFYSFHQLNSRFNQLIRNIPLCLDFDNVDKFLFDHICKEILSNEEIKNQIYSLNLSNKYVRHQIEQFLVIFSFDEFPQLQSLTLTKVIPSDVLQSKFMLRSICKLRRFRLFDTVIDEELFSGLPKFQIQTFYSKLSWHIDLLNHFPTITNLTISKCSTYNLYRLLSTIPDLKYFKVELVFECGYRWYENINISDSQSINLKRLIMLEFYGQYPELELILKQTPNLTIEFINKIYMINPNQLEYLISSLLVDLKIFKFIIVYTYNDSIEDELQTFQSDFWCTEHHWYTEYVLSKNFALVYTIPYMLNKYELIPYTKIYYNDLLENINRFENVKHLIIYFNALTETYPYYFSHPTSLTLESMFHYIAKPVITVKRIEKLKSMINSFNIKELDISHCKLETPSVLLELLKETPQLSSLNIHSHVLKTLLDDKKLYQYLNKMITKLNTTIQPRCSTDDSCDRKKFCKIFSNLEQLICQIEKPDSLVFLLKSLPKLSQITVFFFKYTSYSENSLEKLHLNGKNINYFYNGHFGHLTIWLTKKVC